MFFPIFDHKFFDYDYVFDAVLCTVFSLWSCLAKFTLLFNIYPFQKFNPSRSYDAYD